MTHIAIRKVDGCSEVLVAENSRKKFHERVTLIKKEHPDWKIEIDWV